MLLKEKLLQSLCVDNEYLDKYVKLIEDNKYTKKEKFKTEKHHIIPCIWFKCNKVPIDNSNTNLVNLLYKDHVLAHYYLSKCTNAPINDYNLKVFIRMTFYKIKISDTEKEQIYKLISDDIQTLHERYKLLNSAQNKGKKQSKETCEKRSNSLKGKKRSEETKQKMRKPKSELHVQHMREAQRRIKRKPE